MVCVWFPTSTFKLKVELNGSRRSFLCVTLTRLKTRLVESGENDNQAENLLGMCAV